MCRELKGRKNRINIVYFLVCNVLLQGARVSSRHVAMMLNSHAAEDYQTRDYFLPKVALDDVQVRKSVISSLFLTSRRIQIRQKIGLRARDVFNPGTPPQARDHIALWRSNARSAPRRPYKEAQQPQGSYSSFFRLGGFGLETLLAARLPGRLSLAGCCMTREMSARYRNQVTQTAITEVANSGMRYA